MPRLIKAPYVFVAYPGITATGLQSLLTSAGSVRGIVHLAPGTFDMGGTSLSVPGGVTLEGSGPSETIISFTAPASGAVALAGDRARVRDLKITGATNAEGAIFTSGAEYCVIDNVHVYGAASGFAGYSGIKINGSHNRIRGCTVENVGEGIWLSLSGGGYNLVEACHLTGAGDTGIIVEGTAERIVGNRVVGFTDGISVAPQANSADRTLVEGNWITGAAATTGSGVKVYGVETVVRDNTISTFLTGVECFPTTPPSGRGLQCLSNRITSVRYGVSVVRTTAGAMSVRTVIDGNYIVYTTTNAAPGCGILFGPSGAGGGLQWAVICRNQFDASGSGTAGIGISVTGVAGATCVGIVITMNVIDGNGISRAIVADRLDDSSIVNNVTSGSVTNSIVTTNTTAGGSDCHSNRRNDAVANSLDANMGTAVTNR